jgi:hypothetical protein
MLGSNHWKTRLTWVLVLEFSQVVNVVVDDDEEIIGLIMRCYIALAECFRHREGIEHGIMYGIVQSLPRGIYIGASEEGRRF